MFILTIKKPDQSFYWREHFNTLDALNLWLNEEKTRQYWNSEFTYDIEEISDPVPTQEETAAEQTRLQNIATLKARLKALAGQQDLTAAEIKEGILKLMKMLYLMRTIE